MFLNTILLSFQDGPAETSVANGGTAAASTALNDDLDIFGPMISNPLPAAAVPPAQVNVIYLYLCVNMCVHAHISHQETVHVGI